MPAWFREPSVVIEKAPATLSDMTEIAASDFRHAQRHIRLDTILRLRWLAVLGQLAAIFIVAQGLEFNVEIIPCVSIIALSAALNLALQTAANPMQRLEPMQAEKDKHEAIEKHGKLEREHKERSHTVWWKLDDIDMEVGCCLPLILLTTSS